MIQMWRNSFRGVAESARKALAPLDHDKEVVDLSQDLVILVGKEAVDLSQEDLGLLVAKEATDPSLEDLDLVVDKKSIERSQQNLDL